MTFDPKIPSTTESGETRPSDEKSLSVGADGPLMLHDVALVQKLARFDRERIPERSPHAKGSGACLLYTSPSPRDRQKSRMPSSA